MNEFVPDPPVRALTMAELLAPLARRRTNEVVVTTMSAVRPWACYSDSDLDFASADSAMGHAADLALGIALARPDRRVICLNGDGSMLMTLGTLATIVGSGVTNLVLFVVDNGGFEITGHQPLADGGRVGFANLAQAAGFPHVYYFDHGGDYAEALDNVLESDGPAFVHAVVRKGAEGPIGRGPEQDARYLRVSLAESARILRDAL